MTTKLLQGIVTPSDIAEATDMNIRAIRSTYMKNEDKLNMLKVLAYGTYMVKNNITPREAKLSIECIKSFREALKEDQDVG